MHNYYRSNNYNAIDLFLKINHMCQLYQVTISSLFVRLREEGLNELLEVMPLLKSLPVITQGVDFSDLLEATATQEAPVTAVDFPLFVRSVKWMWLRRPETLELLR